MPQMLKRLIYPMTVLGVSALFGFVGCGSSSHSTSPPADGGGATGGDDGAGGTGGEGGEGDVGSTGGAGGMLPGALYVVAHPSDELLFMNPDVESDIQAGRPVTTVYLTSSDGGDPNPTKWQAHETSEKAAQAAMAAVANSWSCATATYAGKPTTRCTLAKRPNIVLISLRVLDGNVPGFYNTSAIGTADGATTYTRLELIATLTAIQVEAAPQRLGTMDGTMAFGSDHGDHVAAGVLMFDVARADGVAREVTVYRAYNMYEPSFAIPPFPMAEPPNLSQAQYQEKLRIIKVYEPPPLDDSFDEWCKRLYPIRVVNMAGIILHSSDGRCLQATSPTEGSRVSVGDCSGGAEQQWTVGATSRLVGPGGKCVTGADGTSPVIKTCDPAAADQTWTLLDDGQIHGTGWNCLTVSGNMVSSMPCAPDMTGTTYAPLPSQLWTM